MHVKSQPGASSRHESQYTKWRGDSKECVWIQPKNMFEDWEVSQTASLKRHKKKCGVWPGGVGSFLQLSVAACVNVALQVRNLAELTGLCLSWQSLSLHITLSQTQEHILKRAVFTSEMNNLMTFLKMLSNSNEPVMVSHRFNPFWGYKNKALKGKHSTCCQKSLIGTKYIFCIFIHSCQPHWSQHIWLSVENRAADDEMISKNSSFYISIQPYSVQISSKSIRGVLCMEDEHLHVGAVH